jgi:hypothetical protein
MYKQEVFAANYLMGPQTLLKLSRDASPYRDDKPVLEYQTARNYYSRSRYHDLIEKNLDDPETIFADKIRIASEIKIIQIREEMLHEALKEH